MERPLTVADAAAVRAAIARCILASPLAPLATSLPSPIVLRGVTLLPHQADAVARLRALLAESGGALLADTVGLGKTYVALALARDATCPLVVAPAALHDMWRRAMDATGVHAPLLSFEALSRRCDAPRRSLATCSHAAERGEKWAERDQPVEQCDLVVVDEAHHARNPATRRYRALGRLAFRARVLLLSATPIHNGGADLRALLALFLGARAHALDDRAAARFVVRRDRSALGGEIGGPCGGRLPEILPPTVLALPADDRVADAILALPPPLPPSDGGDGGALLAHVLVRQWASSDAALRAALRRRLARAHAIARSLDRGVYPSRAELRAWTSDGAVQQLAFAELLAPADRPPVADLDRLRDAVRAHEHAVRALLSSLDPDDARDDARAALLRELCDRHRGERLVAFASFGETVDTLFRRLHRAVRAGALTAAGAVVAGGPLSRREAIARFAPSGSGASPPREADRVDLLLTTDLLSEGVNLQDASVVLHLDLPWTAARLEQRVGRAARLGARHTRVAVYALAPPASTEGILRVERRLREKLAAAGRAVGVVGAILPAPLAAAPAGEPAESFPQHAECVRRVLASWRAAADHAAGGRVIEPPSPPLLGAVRASVAGFLAACAVGDADAGGTTGPRSVASVLLAALGPDGVATDDPVVVRRCAEAAAGAPGVEPSSLGAELALGAVAAWSAGRRVASAAGIGEAASARGRRRVIERIARITRRAPPHRRAALAALARDARRAALAPCGAGGDWVLDQLARADLPDEAWLRAVRAFGAVAPSPAEPLAAAAGELEVVALLLLQGAG